MKSQKRANGQQPDTKADREQPSDLLQISALGVGIFIPSSTVISLLSMTKYFHPTCKGVIVIRCPKNIKLINLQNPESRITHASINYWKPYKLVTGNFVGNFLYKLTCIRTSERRKLPDAVKINMSGLKCMHRLIVSKATKKKTMCATSRRNVCNDLRNELVLDDVDEIRLADFLIGLIEVLFMRVEVNLSEQKCKACGWWPIRKLNPTITTTTITITTTIGKEKKEPPTTTREKRIKDCKLASKQTAQVGR